MINPLFPRPRSIVAILRDGDERIDVDRFRGVSSTTPQSVRLLRLRTYIQELERQWAAYEAGLDPYATVAMADALIELEAEEKRADFIARTRPAREDLVKEGNITTRLVLEEAARLRAANTPERLLAGLIAPKAGVGAPRVRQILRAATSAKTKTTG